MTSGGKNRVRDDPLVRRTKILDETIRLIGERGYNGFTVQDLARRCGLTNGGLLYHFGSKEQLLLAVLQELTLRQTDRVRSTLEPETRAAARQGTSLAAALEILRLFVMFSVSDPELAQLAVILQSEARDPSHPAHNYFREQEEMVLGIFSSLLAPYVGDPRSAARHVYALMDGLEGQWLRSGQAFDLLEEWDRAIARILPEKTIAGEGT